MIRYSTILMMLVLSVSIHQRLSCKGSQTVIRMASTSSRTTYTSLIVAPVTVIKGVGAATSVTLEQLSITRVSDLLLHFPTSIIDRSNVLSKVTDIVPNNVNTIRLTVDKLKIGFGNAPARITCLDESGKFFYITCFTGKYGYLQNTLKTTYEEGSTVIVSGKVALSSFSNEYEMTNPDVVIEAGKGLNKDVAANDKRLGIEPIYPLTSGLSASQLRKFVKEAMDLCKDELSSTDWIAKDLLQSKQWPNLYEALTSIHNPRTIDCLHHSSKARERIAFDELVVSQLQQLQLKHENKVNKNRNKPDNIYSVTGNDVLVSALKQVLPFQLTKSQVSAIADITADMKMDGKMSRLIQGDVGTGKTIVAIIAMLHAIEAGKQAVLLAPTEILAKQHYNTTSSYMKLINETSIKHFNRPCEVRMISGSVVGKNRDELLAKVSAREVDVLIGTHALLNENVMDSFQDLGLIVIDEEQKFGVNQREFLADRSNTIYMTATPIPRSMMKAVEEEYGVSTLIEKPPSKRPVKTSLLGTSMTGQLIERIAARIDEGTKIFWVTPFLQPSGEAPGSSAIEREKQLSLLFPGKVGLLHGKMAAAEKDKVMEDFSSSVKATIQILVATTVVEVGVDVPDASICIVERAEYFGLSQLHQIRGRIGRGSAPDLEKLKECHCILLYNDADEGDTDAIPGSASKLSVLVESTDGFRIAEADLLLRGPGDLFGYRQSGYNLYRTVDIINHSHLIHDAIVSAKRIFTAAATASMTSIDVINNLFATTVASASASASTSATASASTKVSTSTTKTKVSASASTTVTVAKTRANAPVIASGRLVDFANDDPTVIVIDLESTGFSVTNDRIIQLAAKIVGNDDIDGVFNAYILPHDIRSLSPEVEKVTGLTYRFLQSNGMSFKQASVKFIDWVTQVQRCGRPVVLLAHNGKRFDFPMLDNELKRHNLQLSTVATTLVDTLEVVRADAMWHSSRSDSSSSSSGSGSTIVRPTSFALSSLHKKLSNKTDVTYHNAIFDCIAVEDILLSSHCSGKWRTIAQSLQFQWTE